MRLAVGVNVAMVAMMRAASLQPSFVVVNAFGVVTPATFRAMRPSRMVTSLHMGMSDDSNASAKSMAKRVKAAGSTLWNRMDTLQAAGFAPTHQDETIVMNHSEDGSIVRQRCSERSSSPQISALGFKQGVYAVVFMFLVKWYRARYITKIPVWDRQPQWNTVITSKEQEKDLRAYTCKTCGSTIFTAKNRHGYFRGSRGLRGMGCFTCGAKGEDNFVMDRDRIVEDVGEDDYFDYERPLDFVTRAERRAAIKEAQGDEEKANQMLVEQQDARSGITAIDDDPEEFAVYKKEDNGEEEEDTFEPEAQAEEPDTPAVETKDEDDVIPEPVKLKAKPKKKKSSAPKKPKPSTPVSDSDMDILDMDDF
uniref:Uncharacterized protein n=1 Tax=Attheya septentrionalis TaxID=420275 RepID=A0A7S2U8N1_9STRA|mmetsp:Transcript_1513/g.2711  ORF Transcript_1513/g.2711 Transcript_1513/m.2711 type:complete len:365 (+) Transcript_1513:175-1269(+)|eukprot:CAMPEP_0198281130 /NCGR_PEP_ID=MMETSP1449-20131203/1116_1 /TAXON_ID=420275 /ORGANISM="Attheya septentrionalis, Strain CCMP2084" /LENGTH=364 /DNA_ID=CAMNT_0043976765 /DNA_START=156 /DNA_END=1250 /DNA_ORIENTATION=+